MAVIALFGALVAAALPVQSAAPASAGDESVASALQAVADGRAAIVMRHALAPGTGDPAHFSLDDCHSQRNLSAEGRAQARRIGEFLGRSLDEAVTLRTSAWCRCRDTALEMDLGAVEVLPALNSFFRNRETADEQTAALRDWLLSHWSDSEPTPAVLVTHQVNVTALTGIFPVSGEMVVVAPADTSDPEAESSRVDGIDVLATVTSP